MPTIITLGAGSARGYGFSGFVAKPSQQAYTTAGTYTWVAPAGVTSVSVVAVGGGGSSYGSTGNVAGNSYFVSTAVVKGGAGARGICAGIGGSGGTYTGDGGGNGGASLGYGGGGSGGYSGCGGYGGSSGTGYAGGAGSGGGGGGGGYGGGGGVGLLGLGSSGSAGVTTTSATGGSGGNDAPAYNITCRAIATGGLYGGAGTGWGGSGGSGGGGGLGYKNNYSVVPGNSYTVVVGVGALGCFSRGAGGAVRIIWPGTTRQFPSTCTGDK